MKTSELVNSKWVFIVCIVMVLMWMLAVETGERLPYLGTKAAFNLRVFVIFPLLLGVMGWFVFLHKWAESGKTGYRMALGKLRERGERIKQIFWGVAGLVLISAGLAWTSIDFSAWAANLFASEPFAQAYRAVDRKAVSNYHEIEMINPSTGESVSLRFTSARIAQRDWKVGDTVCARGRSSIFGTIIESVELKDGADCEINGVTVRAD